MFIQAIFLKLEGAGEEGKRNPRHLKRSPDTKSTILTTG